MRPAYTCSATRSRTNGRSTCPATRAAHDVSATTPRQFQLDVFGEACCCSPPARGRACSTTAHRQAAKIAEEAIADRWKEPDAGIWEIETAGGRIRG